MYHWANSVELESAYITEINKPYLTSTVANLKEPLEQEKKKAHKTTYNALSLYVYLLIKDKLESTDGIKVTPDTITTTTETLKSCIEDLGGEKDKVNPLIQQLHIVHVAQREFTNELVTKLQK